MNDNSDVTYISLAEIMMIFAFIFLLLFVYILQPPSLEKESELYSLEKESELYLKIKLDKLETQFSEFIQEDELPKNWTELEFNKNFKKIIAKAKSQEETLKNNFLKIEKLKKELLSQRKELLSQKDANNLRNSSILLAKENAALKERIEKIWDAAHGVRPCWTVDRNLYLQGIEYPLTAELYDDYFVLRKNWSNDRNADALELGFDKVIDRRLSYRRFANFGQRILQLSKKGGKGTDWVAENKSCRFFLKVSLRTRLNTNLQLLERFFYKKIIN